MADSREVAQRYADLFMQRFSEIDPEDWRKPWISRTAAPMNISGREYRRSNRLLLSMLCEMKEWELPLFLTFQQASRLDVCVRKGERSFPVVWFREWYEKDGKRISEDELRQIPRDQRKDWQRKYTMSYNNVFNITQTDFEQKRPEQYRKMQDAVRKDVETTVECSFAAFDDAIDKGEWLCPVSLTDGDRAYFSQSEDRIVVPRKENFPDQREFYGTLGHEMVHSTGTKERLDRDMGGFFGSPEYAHEELVAELGSAILSSTTGITTGIQEDNLRYLKSWAQAIGDDPAVITRAVTQAASAADLVDSTLHLSERRQQTLNLREIIPDLDRLEMRNDRSEETHKSRQLRP